jgi:hypothetical protein
MIENIKIFGLCCTCNHRYDCLSLRNSLREGFPILHCEEFDNLDVAAEAVRLRQKPKKFFPKTLVPIKRASPILGII